VGLFLQQLCCTLASCKLQATSPASILLLSYMLLSTAAAALLAGLIEKWNWYNPTADPHPWHW
jgi:hypothetical protein